MEFKEPLSQEEQDRLFNELKDNPQAREKLIIHNLKLVHWVASKYVAEGKNELDDLFQQGTIGLMRAIEDYDQAKGAFSTYAVLWIKQFIHRYIYDHQRTVRIPIYMLESIRQLSKDKSNLEKELRREPTLKELSIKINEPLGSIEERLNLLKDIISLDQELKDSENGVTLGDMIEDKKPRMEKTVIEKIFVENLLDYIKPQLSDLEYNSIILFYGFNCPEHSLKEIGIKHGVNNERARQAKCKALRDIRQTAYIQQEWKEERERIVNERTSFLKSRGFSNTRVTGGERNASPVESLVLQREQLRKELLKEHNL